MADVTDTLADRGQRYGDFRAHAEITQGLKGVMQKTAGWDRLTASMKEALEMVMHKVGRILNGDPTYADSWHDISGYAKLVDDELTGVATPRVNPVPPEFLEPAAPKTRADFAKAVTPRPLPEPEPEEPVEADAVAVSLPQPAAKYAVPSAPPAAPPAAPTTPVEDVDAS